MQLASGIPNAARFFSMCWVALLLLPDGWWRGQAGSWEFDAGLYSVRRFKVGDSTQVPEWDWLGQMGGTVCDSSEVGSPLCKARQIVLRSSLVMQGAGAACACALFFAATVADWQYKVFPSEKAAFYWMVSMLYAAPVIAVFGIMQFTYMAMDLEGGWLNLGPAYFGALFLVVLSSLPLFLAPSFQKSTDESRRAVDGEPPDCEAALRARLDTHHSSAPLEVPLQPGMACPGGHVLTAFVSQDNVFACDLCDRHQGVGSCLFGCRICNIDICLQCRNPAMMVEHPLFSKVRFGAPQISEYQVKDRSGEEMDSGEDSDELDSDDDPLTSDIEELPEGVSAPDVGVMERLWGAVFNVPTPILDGFLWKMNSDVMLTKGHEGYDKVLEDIGNWRRRWFTITGSAQGSGQGLTMGYLSEKSNGQVSEINTVVGMEDVWTRYQVLPVVNIHRVYDQKEYDAIFRMKAYDTAFEHKIPAMEEEGQQIPSTLFPFLLAWMEGGHKKDKGKATAAVEVPEDTPESAGAPVVLSERTLVLACDSEEQRRAWVKVVQRMSMSRRPSHQAPKGRHGLSKKSSNSTLGTADSTLRLPLGPLSATPHPELPAEGP